MRTKLLTQLLGCIALFTVNAYALTSPTLTKEAWKNAMKAQLPARLCQPQHHFMQCYAVNSLECIALTSVIVDGCLKGITQLPDKLNVQETDHSGNILARCSVDMYEKYMKSKKRDLPECQVLSPEQEPKANPTKAEPTPQPAQTPAAQPPAPPPGSPTTTQGK